jgi:hypothetical protein
MHHNAFFLQ